MSQIQTIKSDVTRLLTRKRPLTYGQIVDAIQAKHPEAQTSVKSVAWYASRLRAEGVDVNVKRSTAETARKRAMRH